MLENRSEAGQLLSKQLLKYKSEQPIILALPRGGVPVACEIAESLQAPLDVFLVRKIGAPWNPEFAVGALTNSVQVINREALNYYGMNESDLKGVIEWEREEVKRRNKLYRRNKGELNIEGRTVILVDDGIATGMTVMAGIQALRKMNPKKLILAVPVLPAETLTKMKHLVDECVYLDAPSKFYAVSAFYSSFPQVTDDEVLEILEDETDEGNH